MSLDPELVWLTLPPIGWVLWTVGGYNWKPARRFVWPTVCCGTALFYGVTWWIAAITLVLMTVTLSIGYGDNSKLLKMTHSKAVVWILMGILYAASIAFIALNWWLLIVAIYFPLGMSLSQNWYPSWTHKLVEGIQGLLQGIAVSWFLFFR